MFDAATLADRYEPRAVDAPVDVFRARLEACEVCHLRDGLNCRLAHQLCSVLARPAGASCQDGRWPREEPTIQALPFHVVPLPGKHLELPPGWEVSQLPDEAPCTVTTVREAPPATIEHLVVITSFFNPQNYRRPLANFHRFAAGIAETGLSLYSAELAFDDDSWQLPGPNVIHVRGTRARHLMFQKERMLNLLIQRLPADVDAIAWIDADVLFLNRNWVDETLDVLSRHHVCQLHALCYDLRPNGDLVAHNRSTGCLWSTDPEAHNDYRLAHPGFAWAARADWLRRFGLFDRMITGGGDVVTVEGFTGLPGMAEGMGRPLSPGWRKAVGDWSCPVHAAVARSLSHVQGSILHLYHGSNPDRRYGDRWKLLIDYAFDPLVDIELDAVGLWRWTDAAAIAKPGLIDAVADCFASRREDD